MPKLLIAVLLVFIAIFAVIGAILHNSSTKASLEDVTEQIITSDPVINESIVEKVIVEPTTEIKSAPEITEQTTEILVEELIPVEFFENPPLLGFKTRDEIINDFLTNDDLINFSQEDKTEEEIIQNLIDKNIITIYTFFYTDSGESSMWIPSVSLEERDKLDSFRVAHKKFGDNFDDFYNFELSIYTQDCLEKDLFADFSVWNESGQIYVSSDVFERICWGYGFNNGYSFDVTNISDSEITFNFYIYKPYDYISVYLDCTKRSAVKDNGKWVLTEILW